MQTQLAIASAAGLLVLPTAATLVLASSALVFSPHEAEKHSSKPTKREIAAVAAESFQMKTALGTAK